MIAGLVLAAGGSTRLGRPKPLLLHAGQSLVRHAVGAALGAGCRPVHVVVGAEEAALRGELENVDPAVRPVFNPDWPDGLASSIRVGVESLGAVVPFPTAVVMLTSDQPHISVEAVRRLIAAYDRKERRMVASAYDGTLGVPALFDAAWFSELAALSGDRGARGLLVAHPERVVAVPWPEGAVDIDEPGDLGLLDGGGDPDPDL